MTQDYYSDTIENMLVTKVWWLKCRRLDIEDLIKYHLAIFIQIVVISANYGFQQKVCHVAVEIFSKSVLQKY